MNPQGERTSENQRPTFTKFSPGPVAIVGTTRARIAMMFLARKTPLSIRKLVLQWYNV